MYHRAPQHEADEDSARAEYVIVTINMSSQESSQEVPNPTTLERATKFGTDFARRLQDHDQYAQSSQWTDLKSMDQWGWKMYTCHPGESFNQPKAVLAAIARASSSSPNHDMSNVRIVETHHNTSVDIEGVKYLATMGRYLALHIPGIIYAAESKCPEHAGRDFDPPLQGPWPALRHWSDILFYQYNAHFPDEDLNGVVRAQIKNKETNAVIKLLRQKDPALRVQNIAFGEQRTYGRGESTFHALLGTPNGKGVAWLLLLHGEELGMRPYVSEISMWWDVENSPTIWFKIESQKERTGWSFENLERH